MNRARRSPIEYRRPLHPSVTEQLCRTVGVLTIVYHGLVVVGCLLLTRLDEVVIGKLRMTFTHAVITPAPQWPAFGYVLILFLLCLPQLAAIWLGVFLCRTAPILTENPQLGVRRCERYYGVQMTILLFAWLGLAFVIGLTRREYSPWPWSILVTAVACLGPIVITKAVLMDRQPDPADEDVDDSE